MAASRNRKKQNMSILNTEQFKKDWITTLVSTSGIMLTLSLMILTILYTATSISIYGWQKMFISASIAVASLFFMFCAERSLNALGTLVITVSHQKMNNAKKAEESDKKAAEWARKAQWHFKRGLWFLIAAIFLGFFFLNWSVFGCVFTK